MRDLKSKSIEFIKVAWQQDEILNIFELVTEDFTYESPITDKQNFDWFAEYVRTIKASFSNLKIEVKKIFRDENSVCVFYDVIADHIGEIFNIQPSGKTIKFEVVTFLDFEEDLVNEMKSVFDAFDLKNQLIRKYENQN